MPLPHHFLRERNGLFHGHILDWDKKNNVHSAHTGMLPLVFVQVDELYGHADGFEHGIAERFGSPTTVTTSRLWSSSLL